MNIHSYIHNCFMKTSTPKKLSSGVNEAVNALKILSSRTRFMILKTLTASPNEDICVNEIAHKIGMTQSATSHQLARLEDKGIVTSFRDGQIVCYKLTKSLLTNQLIKIIKEFD